MAEIIDLKRKKMRAPIPQSVRFNVFRRDNFTCRYCGRSSPEVVLHCDHAVSVKEGGNDSEANLVTSCIDCNLGKSSKSVIRAQSSKPVVIAQADPLGLVGMWGHTFDETGDICWQFNIIRKISDDQHLCQLFSWWDGDATECVPIEDSVLLKSCKLYASNEARSNAYQKHCDQMRRKRQAERWGANN